MDELDTAAREFARIMEDKTGFWEAQRRWLEERLSEHKAQLDRDILKGLDDGDAGGKA